VGVRDVLSIMDIYLLPEFVLPYTVVMQILRSVLVVGIVRFLRARNN
jgi:hypothetical protein